MKLFRRSLAIFKISVFLLFKTIDFTIRKMILFIREYLFEFIAFPFLLIISRVSRFKNRKIDIGIGPLPIVSHQYQKKALELYGYKAETYVDEVYFITSNFDIRGDLFFSKCSFLPGNIKAILFFIFIIFRYRCLYLYFDGGLLSRTHCFGKLEPFLYRFAGIKTVVTAYGGDVQDLGRCDNLLYKSALSKDYPNSKRLRNTIEKRIDLWTTNGDYILGGCDWVKYMYHWDSLVLAHFTVDTEEWKSRSKKKRGKKLIVFHAPNHVNIKGTKFIIDAVTSLKAEGYNVELLIKQKVKHTEVKEIMSKVDMIVDQLVIGWYGMFAVEAMSFGIPVLCYIDKNLENLFIYEGIIKKNELPLIKCDYSNIKEKLKYLVQNKSKLQYIGKKSRSFAIKYHSIQAMGRIFDKINRKIDISPTKIT